MTLSVPSVKIAHIADVHVRSLSRHDEYRQVFQAFARQLREQGVQHVYVGGDVFHTKTTNLSPEYIDFMSWLFDVITGDGDGQANAELHITLGNHDGNLINKSRQDAVSPIVAANKNPRVHLYKKSGVYQFAPGYNWCVFSLFDEEGWVNVKPVPGEVNIACYHGPVSGAHTESNWEIETDMKVDVFKDYDLCFLGDIHATQFLDYREVELEIDDAELHRYPGAEVIA
jgi:hypothetical protein